jgi:alpha-tubulin suppressor-like RCC1 family protein
VLAACPAGGLISIQAGVREASAQSAGLAALAWSDNSSGQQGNASRILSASPVKVTNVGATLIRIVRGDEFTLALRSDGTAWAWGDNSVGQVDVAGVALTSIPMQVPGLSQVTNIGAGLQHSLASVSTGSLRAWGENDHGQLGDGTTVDRSSPVSVNGVGGTPSIAAAWRHTLAVNATGTVHA